MHRPPNTTLFGKGKVSDKSMLQTLEGSIVDGFALAAYLRTLPLEDRISPASELAEKCESGYQFAKVLSTLHAIHQPVYLNSFHHMLREGRPLAKALDAFKSYENKKAAAHKYAGKAQDGDEFAEILLTLNEEDRPALINEYADKFQFGTSLSEAVKTLAPALRLLFISQPICEQYISDYTLGRLAKILLPAEQMPFLAQHVDKVEQGKYVRGIVQNVSTENQLPAARLFMSTIESEFDRNMVADAISDAEEKETFLSEHAGMENPAAPKKPRM